MMVEVLSDNRIGHYVVGRHAVSRFIQLQDEGDISAAT